MISCLVINRAILAYTNRRGGCSYCIQTKDMLTSLGGLPATARHAIGPGIAFVIVKNIMRNLWAKFN